VALSVGAVSEKPSKTTYQTCTQRCKSVAKKAFDVLSLLGDLGLMTFGAVLIIGEQASVQPNRGAGFGGVFLGAIIVKGNVDHIRNW
jgi:hypothetical protein